MSGIVKAAQQYDEQQQPGYWEWVIKDRIWNRMHGAGVLNQMSYPTFKQHIIDALDAFERTRTEAQK